jgi:4-hydroxybenzoyl-CoA reductase subunit beta
MKESAQGLRIGALVPLGVLERSAAVASRYPGLKEAIRHLAVPAIRNAGTIGGNACLDTKCIYRDQVQTWERALAPCFKMGGKRCYVVPGGKICHASFAADTVPVLIILRAKAKVVSLRGEKTLPVEDLYTGNGIRPLTLSAEEMVGEIFLPRPEKGMCSAYLRYSMRQAIDFPLASAAVGLVEKKGICAEARVVLGAVAPRPLRLAQVETVLKGQKITEELFKKCSRQAPGEALRISQSGRIDSFTKTMITNLVYQALKQAWPAKDLRGEE